MSWSGAHEKARRTFATALTSFAHWSRTSAKMMLEVDGEKMLINLAWFTARVLMGMALYNIILMLLVLILDKWRKTRRMETTGSRTTPPREELVDPEDLDGCQPRPISNKE